jgi:quercetin dioxygenase-like cupin family protein
MDRFEDERGVIQDLCAGKPVNVTYVSTVKGAVRGNHLHKQTTQWTYVSSGRLKVADSMGTQVLPAGQIIHHGRGEPHAWQALEDSECLVFTKGPRGEDYESDTERLTEPLI